GTGRGAVHPARKGLHVRPRSGDEILYRRLARCRLRQWPMAARARSGDVGTHRAVSDPLTPRLWPAVLAAVSGSVMVGFMPWIARHLYAEGLSAPSMLFWRYVLALMALIIAARAIGLDLRAAGRPGAWWGVLVGRALGAA